MRVLDREALAVVVVVVWWVEEVVPSAPRRPRSLRERGAG